MEHINKCLCGKTGVVAKDPEHEVAVCHCSMCRKWSGGPYLNIKQTSALQIHGEAEVSFYDSSEWAERAFCKHCGTHLFYRLKASGESYVSAGLLDDNKKLVLDHQIFIDEKPTYYNFAEQTENLTGEQVFAFLSAQQDQ